MTYNSAYRINGFYFFYYTLGKTTQFGSDKGTFVEYLCEWDIPLLM